MEPTVPEAAGDELTAEDDEEDDEVVTGVLLLDELELDGGSSGPYICALEAGVGRVEPDSDMAKGAVLQATKV